MREIRAFNWDKWNDRYEKKVIDTRGYIIIMDDAEQKLNFSRVRLQKCNETPIFSRVSLGETETLQFRFEPRREKS